MATIYARGKDVQENAPPVVGAMYWWFQGDRVLLVLTVLKSTYEPTAEAYGVQFKWHHYMGLVNTDHPVYEGEVTWDRAEWEAACLKEFINPVRKEDLAADEELCHVCYGMYFETGTDLEIMGCLWCDKDKLGTNKKREPTPLPSQRSALHPVVSASKHKA